MKYAGVLLASAVGGAVLYAWGKRGVIEFLRYWWRTGH